MTLDDFVSIPLPDIPVGGRLKHFVDEWKAVTSDPDILQIVQGMHIPLEQFLEQECNPSPQIPMSREEMAAADEHIQTLLKKGAIWECPSNEPEPGEFISNVFLWPKKDGSYHMILNLKKFNEYVQYKKLKMETLNHILSFTKKSLQLITKLGFLPHPTKCHVTPQQVVEILGFIVNLKMMSMYLFSSKVTSVQNIIGKVLKKKAITIRELCRVIGKLVSCFSAVPLGQLNYRSLERLKTSALVKNHRNFEALCTINAPCIRELKWWYKILPNSSVPISRDLPTVTIFTDASSYGWGACCYGQIAQGFFTLEEQQYSINTKET